jgi:predicted DNA-binding protein (MmcQ/YjbR family)
MDGERLLVVAEEAAKRLPAAAWEHPFGPDWAVFKVGGKVFLLATDVPGRAVITVKCEPEIGAHLIHEYVSLSPGYHMNKRHWVSAWAGDDVHDDLVSDLVKNSYRLVSENLPQRRRRTTAPPGFATSTFQQRWHAP